MDPKARIAGVTMSTVGLLALAIAFLAPVATDAIAPASAEADVAAVDAEPAVSWGQPLGVCGGVLLGSGLLVMGLTAFPPGRRKRRYF